MSHIRYLLVLVLLLLAHPTQAQGGLPGQLDPTFSAMCLINGSVANAIVVQQDGRIVAGGPFSAIFSAACANGIFRCHSNGAPDNTFASPFGGLTEVKSLYAVAGGKVLAAGSLHVGNTRYAVARLLTNGALDPGFALSQTNVNFTPCSVATDTNGRIVLAGALLRTSPSPTNVGYITRLNSDGTEDESFHGGIVSEPINVQFLPVSSGLAAVAVQADNKILIGGAFTNVGSALRQGIARLNEDGTLDDTFQAPFFYGFVTALKLLTNGQIFVTGAFEVSPDPFGNLHLYLARLNAEGSIDSSFQPVRRPDYNGVGNALAVQMDGKAIVAFSGRYSHENCISRFNYNGSVDEVFVRDNVQSTTYRSVALDLAGRVIVGRERHASFEDRHGLIRLFGGEPPPPMPPRIDVQPANWTTHAGGTATFTIAASGTVPLIYRWFFAGASVGGSTNVTFNNVQLADDNTSIHCVVTNVAGAVTSSIAILHVVPLPVLPRITTNPASLLVTNPAPITAGELTESGLRGKILHMRILDGAAPFPASGGFKIILAGSENTYSIPGGGVILPSSGNWTLAIESASNAVLTLDSSFPGAGGGAVNVAVRSNGTYAMYAEGMSNVQHGTYTRTFLDGATVGPSVIFTVAATGTQPLIYQWRFDNQPVESIWPYPAPFAMGADTATLTISNASARHNGLYSCVVRNAAGMVLSDYANLYVIGPPTPDVMRPRLTITTPRALVTRLTTNSVLLAGTAMDETGIAGVSVQRGPDPVKIATNTTEWAASVDLKAGTNAARIWAQDYAGNNSLTNGRTIVFVVSNQLALSVTGMGTVRGATNLQGLEIGRNYTLTAIPGAGYVLSNWTGNGGAVLSTAAKYSFMMQTGLVLTANFVPTPYIRVAGTYNGLFKPNGTVLHANSGSFKLTTSGAGTYTASLQLGGKKYAASGRLNLEGKATNYVFRSGFYPLIVVWDVDLHGADLVTGSANAFDWSEPALLKGNRAIFNARMRPAPSTRFTVLFPPDTTTPESPQAHGYGTVTLATSGTLTFAGSLADGTRVSQAVSLSKNFEWPLFGSLYGGRGSILGWVEANTNSPTENLLGSLNWVRGPSPTPKLYTNGFAAKVALTGSIYHQPPPGMRILGFTNGWGYVAIGGGNYSQSFSNFVTVGFNNVVTNGALPNLLMMRFTLVSGLFTGTFTDSATMRRISFNGAVHQGLNFGAGYFLGSNESGRVSIEP